ncbi:hypothetical protein MCOR05_003612 [Pyricularia oryzae]|nr:hypothetical protein MCOR05_003612 [Pyricularia oryzae]
MASCTAFITNVEIPKVWRMTPVANAWARSTYSILRNGRKTQMLARLSHTSLRSRKALSSLRTWRQRWIRRRNMRECSDGAADTPGEDDLDVEDLDSDDAKG